MSLSEVKAHQATHPEEMIDFGLAFASYTCVDVPLRTRSSLPPDMVSRGDPIPQSPTSDPMQTKLPEINASELKAVRDFLTGTTDEVRIPRTTRPAQHVRAAVPVHNGIIRARTRSAKPVA